MIVTDPPYQIDNTKAGGKSKLAKSIQPMNTELKVNGLDLGIDPSILEDFIRVMKKPNIYIWCNHKQIPMYLDFFVTKHGCSFDIIIWHKTNPMPLFSNKYMTDKEYCMYFRKGGFCNPPSYKNATTVYNLPINVKDKKRWNHPTIKPLEIISNIIENSSKPEDIVLDPFMGSGTTAVACKNLGRLCVGFEFDQTYIDTTNERLKGSE